MKANIPPFTVGQKVICVMEARTHNKEFSLKRGQTYIVQSIEYNTKYSTWLISVFDNGGKWIPKEFAPIQEQTAPLLTFEKIKETEKEEILIMN